MHSPRFLRHCLVALLPLAVLCACTVSVNTGKPASPVVLKRGDPAEEKAALAAARQFVQQIDDAQLDAVWERAGAAWKSAIAKPVWKASLGGLRATMGRAKVREFAGGGFSPSAGGDAPPGHYCFIFFHTQFETATAEEKVVLNLEDGQWRLVGYWLDKKWGGK
jgi:hypothetical protein